MQLESAVVALLGGETSALDFAVLDGLGPAGEVKNA